MKDIETSRERHLFDPVVGVEREQPEKSTAVWDEVNYVIYVGGEVLEDPGMIAVSIRADDGRSSPANFYRLAADGDIYEVFPSLECVVRVDEEDVVRITGILSKRRAVENSDSGVAEVGNMA